MVAGNIVTPPGDDEGMTNQLILLEPDLFETGTSATPRPDRTTDVWDSSDGDSWDGDPNEFHLDERTRAIGRAGLAAARQALAEAVRRSDAREQRGFGGSRTKLAA
jgi:hypothetical protein